MRFTRAAATAVGLLGINAAAQGLGQTAICPFDGNRGPNVLLAVVQLPDGSSEVDAWLYGYNWCSRSNFVSDSGDICSDTGTDRKVEFMHAPFTNKFGAFDPICYANIDIQFYGCEASQDGGFNYRNVVAWITSKPPDQMTNSAIDAAPKFGPQSGRFGTPPQGAFDQSLAGPQGSTGQLGAQQPPRQQDGPPQGQVGKRQQPQSQGGVGGQGGFNPQQQGSSQPQQQGNFQPQQQGGFGPQQQSPNHGGQQSSYLYQCVDDRELRACVYDGQVDPPSESKYSAFMSCGIMAEA